MSRRIAFRLGPLAFHWYGIILIVGALVGAYVASREAKRRGEDPSHAWDALFYCLLGGILGARFYHVLSWWEVYSRDPRLILRFTSGGLAMYGAIAGGVAALYLYCRLNQLDFLRWLDIGAPGLIMAQAIGRWANFVNEELFGYPTALPWGIRLSREAVLWANLPQLAGYSKFHPLFLYESLWNLVVFVLLLWVGRRHQARLFRGDIMLLYGILYPFGRFFLEVLRPGYPGPPWWPLRHPLSHLFLEVPSEPNTWNIGGIRVAQVLALVSILSCLALLLYRRRRANTGNV